MGYMLLIRRKTLGTFSAHRGASSDDKRRDTEAVSNSPGGGFNAVPLDSSVF
jgi:hypothetical protein